MKDKQVNYRRNDILLIISLCAIAVILCVLIYIRPGSSKLELQILVDGQLIKSVELTDGYTGQITLDTGNVVCIDDGCVYMKSADCPDGLCVKQGKISKSNQSIICLPHRVVVKLVGADSQADADDGLDVMP